MSSDFGMGMRGVAKRITEAWGIAEIRLVCRMIKESRMLKEASGEDSALL